MAFIPAESCEGYSEANLPFPAAKNRGAGFWVWRNNLTLTCAKKRAIEDALQGGRLWSFLQEALTRCQLLQARSK